MGHYVRLTKQPWAPGKGVGENVSPTEEILSICNQHRWNESGPEAEREWPDFLAAGRISLVPCPSWRAL